MRPRHHFLRHAFVPRQNLNGQVTLLETTNNAIKWDCTFRRDVPLVKKCEGFH